ncbi:hypothetical protein RHO12_11525 [Orbus sturtevantii]|uniref:hypothetical protein n=1 Tax=Orbus sturtevantii TaxID=3074109 RepID=UPI00370D95D3
MKNLLSFLLLFFIAFNSMPNANQCFEVENKEVKEILFQGTHVSFQYKYCEYDRNDTMTFEGKQSLDIKMNGQVYTYSNDVSGIGNFGGSMFFSTLGVFGLVDNTTGNSPISILYLTIVENKLVVLGQLTFEQNMGNIIGEPYIESRSDVTNFWVKKLLQSNQEYILGSPRLSFYEGLLFVLSDNLYKDMTMREFEKLSAKLSEYPDLINFYRQKIFFKNNSLCSYNENIIEMDAFGCKINNKQLSICYNYFDSGNLIYRYGDKDKIELELSREIQNDDLSTDTFIFQKNKWQYQVNTNPLAAGILIKNDGKTISFLKCNNNTIETLIFDPIWR